MYVTKKKMLTKKKKKKKKTETQIKAGRIYRQNIWMEFAIEKCSMLIMRSGKYTQQGIELPNQEKIRTLGEKETYKYLRI